MEYKANGHIILFYRPDGTPINTGDDLQDTIEYGTLHEMYHRVAETQIGPYWISTVYLGLDHSYGHGPPLIFETMIFKDGGGIADSNDEYMDRYATWQQALDGHQNVVGALAAIESTQPVTQLGERPPA